ncbi:MAG: endo-1,4-beta-xylanase [Treponema sp.]|nr:endo-1,4-beta-xylanase [Treponema sp.]
MKHLSLLIALLLLLFPIGSCSSKPVNVLPDGRYIPADFAGVVHAGMTNTAEEFDLINHMGIKWILHTFNWSSIEPEQGQWDFSRYETFVDNAQADNIKVIGVLAYDVHWIFEEGERSRYIPSDKIPEFCNYARKTAEYFKGRVDAWCIWNEPNTSRFWTGTDVEFYELTRQAADAVREADSDVILLAGAFNRGYFGLPEKLIRGLFESGAMEKVDGIAFHPYELNAVRSIRLYDKFIKIVDEYGFKDKIWVTEMGFPTGGKLPTKIKEERFPEMVIKSFAHLAAAGSQFVLWYQLFDPLERDADDSEDFFGLVRSRGDYTSKAAEAFRLCALYMPDTICYVLTDGLPGSIRAFWFKGEDKSALVLWKEGLGIKKINIQLPGTDHLLHDIVTGNKIALPSENVINAGNEPVFITYCGKSEEKPAVRAY